MARDFDLGISGPPLYVSMDFIASGLVEMVAGLTAACILFGYAWWAPPILAGAWLMTHYLLRGEFCLERPSNRSGSDGSKARRLCVQDRSRSSRIERNSPVWFRRLGRRPLQDTTKVVA